MGGPISNRRQSATCRRRYRVESKCDDIHHKIRTCRNYSRTSSAIGDKIRKARVALRIRLSLAIYEGVRTTAPLQKFETKQVMPAATGSSSDDSHLSGIPRE